MGMLGLSVYLNDYPALDLVTILDNSHLFIILKPHRTSTSLMKRGETTPKYISCCFSHLWGHGNEILQVSSKLDTIIKIYFGKLFTIRSKLFIFTYH